MEKIAYSFYTDSYGGSRIQKTDWPRLERKARSYLASATFGRSDYTDLKSGLLEKLNYTACELAELLAQEEQSQANLGISSESLGDHSISYSNDGGSAEIGTGTRRVIERNLLSTGILYPGEWIC